MADIVRDVLEPGRIKMNFALLFRTDGILPLPCRHEVSARKTDGGQTCCGKSLNEADVKVTLFQAVPKGDKLDTIVQKAVELGAVRVCPVITARCVSRPDKKSFEKKRERLNRIALEAAKQSGRGIIPEISPLMTFDEAVSELAKQDFPVICYECGGINFSEVGLKSGSSIGVFIGSEGGFESGEVEKCTAAGAVAVGMGRRIMRCETAPLAALSIIMNLTGNI